MASCKVYLVPGFFGFTTLGALNYFHRVSEVLGRALAERGCADAEVIECPTQPTGSIPRRVERLCRHLASTGALEAEEIHFVGHSTGGLDVRLLLSPLVHPAGDRLEEQISNRTRSLITLSTPHHGSPLASFFTTIQGRHLLRALSRLATSSGGRLSVVLAARTLAALARTDDVVGRRQTTLDILARGLFRRLSFDRDDPVWQFVAEISRDQGVILQLTPESLNLFNALASDRSTVAYRCVVTAAPPPPFSYGVTELISPERALLAGVFVAFHTLNRWSHGQYPYPRPTVETVNRFKQDLPFEVTDATNDGIVPTLSQLKGELIAAVAADHLDVVGQYARSGEALSDWLPSASGFDGERFEQLWGEIADAILATREASAAE